MTPTFLILAAGSGSRFGGPKQLAPVGPAGEILMAYALHDAFAAGFRHFAVVTAPGLVSRIDDALRPVLDGSDAELHIAVQQTPTGTASAVLAATDVVNDRFTVSNADDWYGREAYALLWAALGQTAAARHFLVTYEMRNTLESTSRVSRAPCIVGPDGLLTGIEELVDVERSAAGPTGTTLDGRRRAVADDAPVSTNLWGFQSSILDLLAEDLTEEEESMLPSVVADLVRRDSITVETLACSGPFFGITRPADLPRVRARIHELVASGFYPSDLRTCN